MTIKKEKEMNLSKKQRYNDMITVNFYVSEVEKFLEFLDMAELSIERWCSTDKEDKKYFHEIEKYRSNFKLFLESAKNKGR